MKGKKFSRHTAALLKLGALTLLLETFIQVFIVMYGNASGNGMSVAENIIVNLVFAVFAVVSWELVHDKQLAELSSRVTVVEKQQEVLTKQINKTKGD